MSITFRIVLVYVSLVHFVEYCHFNIVISRPPNHISLEVSIPYQTSTNSDHQIILPKFHDLNIPIVELCDLRVQSIQCYYFVFYQ